jgi:hypothetical protein
VAEGVAGVTAIIPVVTETETLRETLSILMDSSKSEIGQILLVTCDRTTSESRSIAEELKNEAPGTVQIYEQVRPFLGNAIREAFDLSTQSHVVMMASDLETDPRTFPRLVDAAIANPEAVVTASRWLKRRSFSGYGPLRVMLNYIFQLMGRIIYWTSLSDLTFGYRLFPTELVQRISWEYERHNFLLETILKPLRLGVPIVEVPTSWVPRSEGASQNSLRKQAEYIATLVRCRFIRKKKILKSSDFASQKSMER